MKKVSILQSNYIPWKGYFDLIASVDEFIIYDEMQYTKNDWRNRNKIKTSKGSEWITIPVRIVENSNFSLPQLPDFSTNNAHMFYLIFKSLEQKNEYITKLKSKEIYAVFHYLSLHKSPFYASKHTGGDLLFSDHYSETLLRLPMYYELSENDVDTILNVLRNE